MLYSAAPIFRSAWQSIDACNQVMDKVSYPKGLIRYTSENAMDNRESNIATWRRIFRPRVIIYVAIVAVLSSLFAFSLWSRNPLRVDVMRDRGSLAREVEGISLENIYRIQIMNSSENPMTVSLKAEGLDNLKILDSRGNQIDSLQVEPSSNQLLPIKVRISISELEPGNYPIVFDVEAIEQSSHASVIRKRQEKSTFIVPR
jgi:polyferredoxin